MAMGINYTVLKSSIINSSIWNKDAETCKVWITMLAMRNKDGEIFASVGGLAHQSRISPEKTRMALDDFLAPEGDSSSRDDGRRIIEIPGGWKLLNHDQVKAEAAAANKALYMAGYMRTKRERDRIRRSLPEPGALEFEAALKRGAGEEELDAIVTRHLPKNGSGAPSEGVGG